MNGQRDIFGRELEGEAPTVASPQTHEVMPLFSAPQTMRGQLSAWAESVCDEVERPAGNLAEWACAVCEDVHDSSQEPFADWRRRHFHEATDAH